jgi:1-acyl-sn-glycerol-3-phosphate acyltransferase
MNTLLLDILLSGYFWAMVWFFIVVWFFLILVLFLIDFMFKLRGKLVRNGTALLYKLVVFCSGLRIDIKGMKHLHQEVPVIIVANHQSVCDLFIIGSLVTEPFKFIGKKEIFSIPFLGWIFRMGQHIMFNRNNPNQGMKSFRQASKTLDHGFSLVVFPEGTRTSDDQIKAFQNGPFYLSIKKQVPVVPIRICGFRDILPKHSLRFRPGRASVIIGKPIYPLGKNVNDNDAFTRDVRKVIIEMGATGI